MAFITGSPNFARRSSKRSGVSLPCSCKISGRRASTSAAKTSSVASTVSDTFNARPATRAPSALAVSRPMFRGLGGKNTKPTMSAPASSAASRDSGVESPQILTREEVMPSEIEAIRRECRFQRSADRAGFRDVQDDFTPFRAAGTSAGTGRSRRSPRISRGPRRPACRWAAASRRPRDSPSCPSDSPSPRTNRSA